jgi:hypothetical protein
MQKKTIGRRIAKISTQYDNPTPKKRWKLPKPKIRKPRAK